MKDLRIKIVQTYPSVLPHALAAGVDLDREIIDCFREMNLSFFDRSAYANEQWRLFQDAVYPSART